MGDRKEHERVSPEGRMLGRLTSLMAQHGRRLLVGGGIAAGVVPTIRDEMCASCACRERTVPNGCLQTQMDLLKAVAEGKKFLCHAPMDGRMCAGYIAARASHVRSPMPAGIESATRAWNFSPPDESTP